ncbi:MAG: hypothetical protein E5V86_04015 [Mesorhizobium sp.]|nr:MAG: hypothetical protein E5V86_04015 [Mesorhizobium sp.]
MSSTDNSTTWIVLGIIALVAAYMVGTSEGKSKAEQDALTKIETMCQARGDYLICPKELTW